MKHNKTIGICHYRIGGTDGVSLEILKRKKVLEEMGYRVVLISGPLKSVSDHTIPLLEFDKKRIIKIKEQAFFDVPNRMESQELLSEIDTVADSIKKSLHDIHKKEKLEYLFVHNIFSHGRHISCGKAFYEFGKETGIKLVAINHDFYFAGSYTGLYKPRSKEVRAYLKKYVPPRDLDILYVTINSINQKILKDKTRLPSIILPDTFDFTQKEWAKDHYNADFIKRFGLRDDDIIMLQATRIVRRKGIELAVDLAVELEKRKEQLIGKVLYNGKKITYNSRVVLLLAGYVEPSDKEYAMSLRQKIKDAGVTAKFIGNSIGEKRIKRGNKKIYSLWDAYVHADIVTFPSYWEGWGNQFIEAVFAKKPIVVFEYPVFKADIKQEGYSIVSLGSTLSHVKNGLVSVPKKVLEKSARSIIEQLLDKKLMQVLNKNFRIGKRYHSMIIVKRFFQEIFLS